MVGKGEKITVSDWLQYLQFVAQTNQGSQRSVMIVLITALVTFAAVAASIQRFEILITICIVAIAFYISFKKFLRNPYLLKGKTAAEFCKFIISSKYQDLKLVENIEKCWNYILEKIDETPESERVKLLQIGKQFDDWFKPIIEKHIEQLKEK